MNLNDNDIEYLNSILKSKKHSLFFENTVSRKYGELKEYFNESIPQNILNRFKNEPFTDFILENLQTHDWKLLENKLMSLFGDFIETVYPKNEMDIKASIVIVPKGSTQNEKKINSESIKTQKFNELLEFFGYYYSSTTYSLDIIVEPKYTTKMNSWIYDDCHSTVYHITANRNKDSILKNGLRPRKGTYRIFPERVYVFAKPWVRKSDLYNIAVEMLDVDDINDAVAIKFHLNKQFADFYRDDLMEIENSYFTYSTIPAECIQNVIYNLGDYVD